MFGKKHIEHVYKGHIYVRDVSGWFYCQSIGVKSKSEIGIKNRITRHYNKLGVKKDA